MFSPSGAAGRGPFNAAYDFCQAIGMALPILQGREDQMRMLRHHHRALHVQFFPMVMQTVLEHNGSGGLGKLPSLIGSKSYEEGFIFGLEVREISPIRGFGGFCQVPGAVRHRKNSRGPRFYIIFIYPVFHDLYVSRS